jgi:hypothetical protein
MPREYSSATSFRKALEDRLNRAAQLEQMQVNRLRRQVAFDRLLARLFRSDAIAPWALKGGYALELRFKTARATVDIDLTVVRIAAATEAEANEVLRDMLQTAAGVPLGDWFEYTIGPPMMDLDGAPYGGARFPVEARMDGRIFSRFHLDAGIGDEVIQPVEKIECRDWLDFAGIAGPVVQAISREQQFAEKLHAYTLPRESANSRVKDLVDMALLIRSGGVDPKQVAEAVEITFRRRRTHDVPSTLLPPPEDWEGRFKALSAECGLFDKMDTVFEDVAAFLSRIVRSSG